MEKGHTFMFLKQATQWVTPAWDPKKLRWPRALRSLNPSLHRKFVFQNGAVRD